MQAQPVIPMLVGPLQRRSTRLAFLASGLAMAAWAPLVPFAKSRLGLGFDPQQALPVLGRALLLQNKFQQLLDASAASAAATKRREGTSANIRTHHHGA